ncbi:hypothetical protein PR048_016880 [Dryococelus australis]|uniref:Uncharacterized protein n=1 Tax=Dryococelus australis TaxID=614101 RepID=A0ABQ9H7X3_9NEOP|nr:hypothetical protein PR048_016880 [Dryococelus australis]
MFRQVSQGWQKGFFKYSIGDEEVKTRPPSQLCDSVLKNQPPPLALDCRRTHSENPVDGYLEGLPDSQQVDKGPDQGGDEAGDDHKEEPARARQERWGGTGHADDPDQLKQPASGRHHTFFTSEPRVKCVQKRSSGSSFYETCYLSLHASKCMAYGEAPECKGSRNRRSPIKPAHQRHRPAQFTHTKIRKQPRRKSNPVRLDGRRIYSCDVITFRWKRIRKEARSSTLFPWLWCPRRVGDDDCCGDEPHAQLLVVFPHGGRSSGLKQAPSRRPTLGAVVAQRLEHSPPAKTSRVCFPAGLLHLFRTWESYREIPQVNRFSPGSPVSPALETRRYSIPTSLISLLSTPLLVTFRPRQHRQLVRVAATTGAVWAALVFTKVEHAAGFQLTKRDDVMDNLATSTATTCVYWADENTHIVVEQAVGSSVVVVVVVVWYVCQRPCGDFLL